MHWLISAISGVRALGTSKMLQIWPAVRLLQQHQFPVQTLTYHHSVAWNLMAEFPIAWKILGFPIFSPFLYVIEVESFELDSSLASYFIHLSIYFSLITSPVKEVLNVSWCIQSDTSLTSIQGGLYQKQQIGELLRNCSLCNHLTSNHVMHT